ncbi:MAG: hypothetical protein H6581_11885 [Bacteroidia bacterium]|nr:hypothetical protein [Bacteroidia bacterium]
MKMIPRLLILSTLVLAGAGCKHLHEDFIMNGEWEVTEVNLNNGSKNFLESLMPHYADGNDCCHYNVSYLDNGVMRGEYYTYDTLNYAVEGDWEIVKPGEIYMKADQYIDGVFTYQKESKGHYLLHSDINQVEFYQIGQVEMAIRSIRK